MKTLHIQGSDIRPGHHITLEVDTAALSIEGVKDLNELGKILDAQEVPPADWEQIFAQMNDTTDQIRVLISGTVYLGRKIQWGKQNGKSGTSQLLLSPECGKEIDPDWGDTFAVGSYYHSCGASGQRHFHKESYMIEEDTSPDEALSIFRDRYERAMKE